MKGKILKMLMDGRDYVSGQKMCDDLKVSRTAVWKAINQLKEEGYVIESVTNKGYRIVSSPDLVTKEAVECLIKAPTFWKEVCYKEEVDSTNTEAKRIAEKNPVHGTVVIAEDQNNGKGRRGRGWISQKGSGVWMSFILKPPVSPVNGSMLTLVAGLSVCKAIYQLTGLDARIKWPNDVVMDGKKVCGILTEMSSEMDYINYIVIGIGINVNMEEFPETLKDKATSLYLEGKKENPQFKKISRSHLIWEVMDCFEGYYYRFMNTGDMERLIGEYNCALINIGKEVKVLEGKEEITGLAGGIDKKGQLVIEVDGKLVRIRSGEVSIRGLDGYV